MPRQRSEGGGLRPQVGQEIIEGGHEGGPALVLQDPGDVGQVDTGIRNGLQHGMGGVRISVDGPGNRPVVLGGVEGVVGEGVAGVGPYQAVRVGGVRLGWVLGHGRRPLRLLHPCPPVEEGVPAGAAEHGAEHGVGHLALGHRRTAP